MAYERGGNCWSCGAELGINDYGREDSCPGCGRDTKTCKGCEHYDRGAHNDCHESQAERVVEKEEGNFCDYFRPRAGLKGTGGPTKNDALSAAEALFKNFGKK
jgi:predicted RNA-binding Zn-ribbon protein involved in translation (DUF1610 family)